MPNYLNQVSQILTLSTLYLVRLRLIISEKIKLSLTPLMRLVLVLCVTWSLTKFAKSVRRFLIPAVENYNLIGTGLFKVLVEK
jgi:hypothetical protein